MLIEFYWFCFENKKMIVRKCLERWRIPLNRKTSPLKGVHSFVQVRVESIFEVVSFKLSFSTAVITSWASLSILPSGGKEVCVEVILISDRLCSESSLVEKDVDDDLFCFHCGVLLILLARMMMLLNHFRLRLASKFYRKKKRN